MKKLFYLFVMTAVIGLTASCSDEDEMLDTPAVVDESEEERNFRDSMSAEGVISQMYDVQENGTYTFKRGLCINPSEPNKYYYACSGAQEAALFYNTYCTNEPLKVVYKDVNDSLPAGKSDVVDRESTFGSYGRTSLTIGDGNPVYATIELSINAIGDTHELIFVPESYMPFNSDYAAFQSPYTVGDIYRDNKGNQWLCVVESGLASDGYFVRLAEETYREDGVYPYWNCVMIDDHYKRVWYAVEKGGNTIATKEVWTAFFKMMEYSQGRNAWNAMKNKTNGVSMNPTCDLLSKFMGDMTLSAGDLDWMLPMLGDIEVTLESTRVSLELENKTFSTVLQVGNVTRSGKDYHWKCAYHIYKVWIPFVYITKNSYSFEESYSWHGFDTRGGKIYGDSFLFFKEKKARVMLQLPFRKNKLEGMTKLFPVQSGR